MRNETGGTQLKTDNLPTLYQTLTGAYRALLVTF